MTTPSKRRMRELALGFLFFLAALGTPTFGFAQATSFWDAPPILRPGDMVRVQVWRQPEFSGEFEVTGAGMVAHPLYRVIRVADRPVEEVEAEFRTFLLGFVEDPSFVVEGFVKIAVGGQVRIPDVYPLRPETSVAQAIALAGGPTDRGDMARVIIRRGNEAYTLDLQSPDTRLREIQVRSGDEIIVQRKSDWFRDYIAPSASVVAATATILSILLR
jgi:protein involved in polysaccharide export with SLBB domain